MNSDAMYFSGHIVPKDVRVFVDNGTPYLDYTGIADTNLGCVEIHIPKMSLNLSSIECIVDYECRYSEDPLQIPRTITTKRECCYANDEDSHRFSIKYLTRAMTKSEIEKELGYKVTIKD